MDLKDQLKKLFPEHIEKKSANQQLRLNCGFKNNL